VAGGRSKSPCHCEFHTGRRPTRPECNRGFAPIVMAGEGRPSCVRKRVLSGRCKSTRGEPDDLKPEATASAARRRGEQPEANEQSVGDELDSAVSTGEPSMQW